MARKQSVVTREKRLGAIGAYLGDISSLTENFDSAEPSQRIRTFSQTAPDDSIAALRLLNGITGVGIIVHGARGCAAAQLALAADGAWAVTNLNERDTIMGSDAILRKSILALYGRHQPWVIFVVATPVVAINNDDIQSVVIELSEELGIPVVRVRSDGFRSRIAATGADAAIQAILPLVPLSSASRNNDLINLIVTDGESSAAPELAALLEGIGLAVNILPFSAGKEQFEKAAQAAVTVVVDPDAGALFAQGIEAAHRVPYLKLPVPVGLAATGAWLAAIGAETGRSETAELLHRAQLEAVTAFSPTTEFDGVRVYLGFPVAIATAVASLVNDSGGTVVGVSVDSVDAGNVHELKKMQESQAGVPLHVAAGQPFEEANILRRIAPDLYVGTLDQAVSAARAGIPAVAIHPEELLGYTGLSCLLRRVHKARANKAFAQRLSRDTPPPYKEAWYRRSPDWHIKREVK